MSFVQRQIFKVTHDPEADKLYQEKVKEDRAARETYIEKLESDLRMYEKDKINAILIDEDYEFLKKWVRDRISTVRGSSMTQSNLDLFEDSKQGQEYTQLKRNRVLRKTLNSEYESILKNIDTSVNLLIEKKQKVSPFFKEMKNITQTTIEWIHANKFADSYIYKEKTETTEQKYEELRKKYDFKFQTKSINARELEKAAISKNNESRQEFSITSAVGEALGIAGIITLCFALIVFGLLGSSLATNLNIYKSGYFRTLYAIYGFIFFFIVIPYVFGYRWWWMGSKPRFYSFIPLVPYRFENRWAQLFLSWMSFRPEDSIDALKEWN